MDGFPYPNVGDAQYSASLFLFRNYIPNGKLNKKNTAGNN